MQRFNPNTSGNTKIKYRYQTYSQGNNAVRNHFDKYCSVCGTKMQKTNGVWVCQQCNATWTFPINIIDNEA